MPLASWPATLPQQFLRGTYETALPELRLRSEMEVGPAKVRRRLTSMPAPMRGDMAMTPAQLAILQEFYLSILSGGASAFTAAHPFTGATLTLRFREPPSWTHVGWEEKPIVHLVWEVLP